MAQVKANNKDLRDVILEEDETKDVGVCLSVTTATVAVLTAMCGAGAIIALRALSRFRPDIGGYWMSCIPFIFPGITGAGLAFKRNRTAVSLHVGTMLIALLCGGSSFGYSIEPVFINNNCTDIYPIGTCDRPILLYMYLAAGAASAGFCLLGLLLAFCTCSSASKRLARKARDNEALRYQKEARDRLEAITAKRTKFRPPPPVIVTEKTPNGNDAIAPSTNGISQPTQAVIDDLSTRL